MKSFRNFAPAGGANPAYGYVFQRDGNAVKRPRSRRDLPRDATVPIPLSGLPKQVPPDGEIGVQFGIVAVNAREKMSGQLHGREFSRADSCASSAMERKARSVFVMKQEFNTGETLRVRTLPSKYFFLTAYISNVPRLAMMKATRNGFPCGPAEVDAPVFRAMPQQHRCN